MFFLPLQKYLFKVECVILYFYTILKELIFYVFFFISRRVVLP